MSIDWSNIILDGQSPQDAWAEIFAALLSLTEQHPSPTALHDATVMPDRLLSEAAWELWEAFPTHAVHTSTALIEWTKHGSGKAVLLVDALSLRELPLLLAGAQARNIQPVQVKATGAECPSTTGQFAHALGLSSRSMLANNGKPNTFALFDGDCYTDVVNIPFEDCAIPPVPNVLIWHRWLDDQIHLPNKQPEQLASSAATVLQGDGFWHFVNKLRQGRNLVITSDHGYAVSKRFSSEVEDPEAIKILRETFGASRNKAATVPWQARFMPPIVMTHNGEHMVMGQRKWKVQSGFPHLCHGGMSLLEVAVPYLELPAL